MELKEEKDRWILSLVKGRINYFHIDYRLTVDLVDEAAKACLTIETAFRLKGPNGEVSLTPSAPSSLAPILPLINTKVTKVVVLKTGRLNVDLEGGLFVEVEPDGSYEAWQIGGGDGWMLVCSPGGSVSFFRDTKRSAD